METQLKTIREKLKTDGFITRNWCLQRFCSRLGARIVDLKKEGMNIKGKPFNNGTDYIYRLIKEPKQTSML